MPGAFNVGDTGSLRDAVGQYTILAETILWGCNVLVAKVVYPSGNETIQTRFPDGRVSPSYESKYDFVEQTNVQDQRIRAVAE